MKRAKKRMIVAAVLFFVSIWLVIAAGTPPVWLTEQVRVFGLVMLPTAIVAALLVVYFDWRAKVLSRIREQRYEGRKAA